MLKNYLTVALRNIKKNVGFSFINLTGLAVGLACCILIILWVQDELSYDRFHANKNQLYRVIIQDQDNQGDTGWTTVPFFLAPSLKQDFPEILAFSRFQDRSWLEPSVFAYGDKKFYEQKVFLADPTFFKMFTFTFLLGDPQTALDNINSVVITADIARKYFGKKNPLGKVLRYNNRSDLKVTGVLQKLPTNSHMNFDILAPIQLLGEKKLSGSSWESKSYLLLAPRIKLKDLQKKIAPALEKQNQAFYKDLKVNLQPVTKIHLYQGAGDINLVYIFSSIALFIMLLACINYMNLSTARSVRRALEVGLRKVVGAHKIHLVKQFFSETFFMSLLATFLALLLVFLSLGFFNNLVNKSLSVDILGNPVLFLGLPVLILLVAFFSGSYPALFLSSYRPVAVLKGNATSGSRGALFRKIMVIGQFAISGILIIGTIIVHQQLHYIQTKSLGWDRDNVLAISINSELREQFPGLKHELLQHPNIKNVTAASTIPTQIGNTNPIEWEGKTTTEPTSIKFVVSEHNYLDTFNMKLLRGRNFSRDIQSDLSSFIVNEQAVRFMKLKKPVGTTVKFMGANGPIIGVIKDFHFRHMTQAILPLIITINPRNYAYFYRFVFARIEPRNIPETLSYIKKVAAKHAPNYPFKYEFVDEEFNKLYQYEQYVVRIVDYFTFLALFIACLGLFGLASFMTEQRTKEIGIRKVLGASINSIVRLLVKEFTRWVLIAIILSSPLAYLAMDKWLSQYVYRVSISWMPFLLAGTLTLFIACLTVAYQAVRAANHNPIDTLRSE